MKKNFFMVLGFLFLFLGILGAILPIVPTVPFLLVAAYFFEKGSERIYNWLITNPYFGEHLKNYRVHKGMTKRNKVITIISSIFGISLGMYFMPFSIGKAILFFILIGVIIHIIKIETIKKDS
ncbi:YbaN family protein [Cetobacterium somerae]|uniref:YbaN family protein n=1 Tax=Cetobacterium somerae TaxID=188913 RepID=UPI003D766F74